MKELNIMEATVLTSPNPLTNALKELEADDLIQRIQYNEMPLRVEYFLTEKGRDLLQVFYAISQWGMKYIP